MAGAQKKKTTTGEGVAIKIVDAIKARMKVEAKDLDCLRVLRKKNPELAQLLSDMDNIIVQVAYRELQKNFEKFNEAYDRKKENKH